MFPRIKSQQFIYIFFDEGTIDFFLIKMIKKGFFLNSAWSIVAYMLSEILYSNNLFFINFWSFYEDL